MIDAIELETFKCFATLRLPLRGLSVLTGFNGGGKSTVQQALLLLHQGLLENATTTRMLLSGPIVALGTLRDVVDKVNGSRGFVIGVVGRDAAARWTCESDTAERDDLSVSIERVDWESNGVQHSEADAVPFRPRAMRGQAIDMLLASLRRLQYVPADRSGPAEVYPLEDQGAHETLGRHAERAVGRLYWYGDEEVDAGVRHEGEGRPQLRHQVQAWMAELFPGVVLDVQRVPGANLVSLGIRTSPDTDFHRPQHVGFGITYVLPVVVACLAADLGDLVLVENPEAHLHPRAQAQMGRFLARMASHRQVVVETHSDHVINGMRRAVRDGVLEADAVVVHFFRSRGDADVAQVQSLNIDATGAIEHWPAGFFDQIDQDTMALAGL